MLQAVRPTAAYDWRRIHSATPQRNALTCRDGCAFLSGEGSPYADRRRARAARHLDPRDVGYRDGGRSTICDRSWPICRLRAWASITTTRAVGPAGQDESLWWAAPISNRG